MILCVNQFYHKEQLDFLQFWCYFFIVWTPDVHLLTVYLCAPSPVLGRTGFLEPIDVLSAPMVRMQFVCPPRDHRWDVNFEEIGPSGKSLGHWYV